MNPCRKTGRPVRLGAMKTRINGRSGIHHYIAYVDGRGERPEGPWFVYMEKPYPAHPEKPWVKMVKSWNAENPVSGQDLDNAEAPED